MADICEVPEKKAETFVVNNGIPGLVKGYLEDFFEADIIVNSAPKNMKLHTAGKVSAVILSRAGKGIQKECDEKFPNGIEHCEVAITSGHKLQYSLVFHCTVQYMDNQNYFTEMAKLIKKCLLTADGKEFVKHNGCLAMAKTIAFPLLGTGPKKFSPEICCVFYRTILSFFLGPTKSLENAYIIVTPKDSHLIKVIEDLKPFKEFEQITYEFSYPYTWETTQNNLDVINLYAQSQEYVLIKEEFQVLAPANAQILSIERIQNKNLYMAYLKLKCQYNLIMKDKEKHLWLACDAKSIAEINTNGLNANHMKAARCGKGYYFCEDANLADDLRIDQDDPKKMYYCSVGIGKPIQGNHDYNKDNIPPRCYSAVDNINKPTMYTIFNEKLFYPNYLITYETK